MARIANPIYDAVFKYMMDDPRVAKTLIAAVLKIDKKDILELTPDRNEIIATKRDEVNACRLDFTVRIKTQSGEKAIYIEMQKAWAKGELKRFRSYLASQYKRSSNVDSDEHPLPILSIYILGGCVDTLSEAVTYVTRRYYNQKGIEIKTKRPSQFIECLSHDMVVIQVPKINPRPNSALDNLLTLFDQTKKETDDNQVINYDIDDYEVPKGELRDDMRFIVRRLEQAIASEDVRMKMILEDKVDEMLSEKRTAEEKVAEQEALLQEQSAQLQEQSAQLQQKDSQLQQKESQLQEQSAQLQEQSAQLQEKDEELKKQSDRLIKSIKKFKTLGLSTAEIAEELEVDEEFVKKVLL